MRVTLSRKKVTDLVDSAILVSGNLSEIVGRFPSEGQIPILAGESAHNYFTLLRVQCPPELTTPKHPVHDSIKSGLFCGCLGDLTPKYEKTGPLLVAKLALPVHVRISPVYTPKQEWKAYPSKNPGDAFGRNSADYRILASEHTGPFYLIVGDDCRKQLALWGIKDVGIEGIL